MDPTADFSDLLDDPHAVAAMAHPKSSQSVRALSQALDAVTVAKPGWSHPRTVVAFAERVAAQAAHAAHEDDDRLRYHAQVVAGQAEAVAAWVAFESLGTPPLPHILTQTQTEQVVTARTYHAQAVAHAREADRLAEAGQTRPAWQAARRAWAATAQAWQAIGRDTASTIFHAMLHGAGP